MKFCSCPRLLEDVDRLRTHLPWSGVYLPVCSFELSSVYKICDVNDCDNRASRWTISGIVLSPEF